MSTEKNCLVTTLKGTINDDTLPRLGELLIKAVKVENPTTLNNDYRYLIIAVLAGETVKISTNGNYINGTNPDATPTNEYVYTSTSTQTNLKIYFVNDNFYVRITNKYSIIKFSIYGYKGKANGGNQSVLQPKFSDFNYCTNINSLNLDYSKSDVGNVKDLVGTNMLKSLTFADAGAYGELTDIFDRFNLDQCGTYPSNVTGTVEDIVNGYLKRGVTEKGFNGGSLRIRNAIHLYGLDGIKSTTAYTQNGVIAFESEGSTVRMYCGYGMAASSSDLQQATVIYCKNGDTTRMNTWVSQGKSVKVSNGTEWVDYT